MQLHVRCIGGLLSAADGRALVAAEAESQLWLVGAVCKDEVFIVSAFDATLDAAPSCPARRVVAGMPEGFAVIGAFVGSSDGKAVPAMPRVPASWNLSIQVIAARDADGGLLAWDCRDQGSPVPMEVTTIDSSQQWGAQSCVRGRVSLNFAGGSSGKRIAAQLEEIAAAWPSNVRHHFPGSETVPTLAELQAQQPSPRLPVGTSSSSGASGVITVRVMSDGLGANGPTNFADSNATDPIACGLDFVAYVPHGCESVVAIQALQAAAIRQLHFLAAAATSASDARHLCFRCYFPDGLGHALSLCGTEDAAVRADLHRLLRLPQAPLLRPGCAMPWGSEAPVAATGKPINPHVQCGQKPAWWKGGTETRTAFVRGLYEYAHYMQDRFDDNGWGCAYRSLQTCVSWYRLQHYSDKDMPGITDIQTLLKANDYAHQDLKIGSRTWIGTVEGMRFMQDYLDIDSRMLHCSDAGDMASQMPQVLQHLESVGSPVMMGAGQKAFTMVGLCYDAASGQVAFLIVDPHYTGSDDLKTILAKGWVGWKNLEFFEKEADGGMINLCLPMVPQGSEQI